MIIPENNQEDNREKLIKQRKKEVWLIALAMIAGGCLVTFLLLGLLYFLLTKVFPIA